MQALLPDYWPLDSRFVTPQVVAQSNGDTGVAVLAGLLGLAVLGLQIYLIYAIIATRQDVRHIRQALQGGGTSPSTLGPAPNFPSEPLRSEDLDRLRQAAELRQGGILTGEEFSRIKETMFGSRTAASRHQDAGATDRATGGGGGAASDAPTYFVVLHSLGSADVRHVRSLVSKVVGGWIDPKDLKRPDVVIGSRLSKGRAEVLRAQLDEAGADAEVRERITRDTK